MAKAITAQSSMTQSIAPGMSAIPQLLWQASAFLFGLMICWSLLQPHDSVGVFQGSSLPQTMGWLFTGALASVASLLTGRSYATPLWLNALLLLVLGWLIVVTVLAGQNVNPRAAWLGFWQVMALASCYFTAKGLMSGVWSRAAVIGLCLVGFYGSSWLGGYQVMVEMPSMRQAYREDPERVLRQAGIEAAPGSVLRQQFENRLYSPEPHAAFALANSLAVVLSAGLILLLGLTLEGWQEKSKSPWSKAAIVSLLYGVSWLGGIWFMTLSRTAYLAVAFGLLAWGAESWLRSGNRRASLRWLVGGLVAAVLVAGLGVTWLLFNNRLVLSEAPKSLAFRLEYWWATSEMLVEHGWRGVGLGNFQDYYPRYMLPTASETIADPHNWIFDIAATLSVPVAALAVVWILQVCTLRCFALRRSKASSSKEHRFSAVDRKTKPQTAAIEATDKSGAQDEARAIDQQTARVILWGGMVGGVLCISLLSFLAGYRMNVYLCSWALAAALVALQYRWLPKLMKSAAVLRAALITMLVCLLASGSWQASGIAVPLLMLVVCLQAACSEDLARSTLPSGAVGNASAVSGWLSTVLPVLGLAVFIWQCWLPVTRSWVELGILAGKTSLRGRIAAARQAAEDDPLDSEPQRLLSSLLVVQASEATADTFDWEADASIEQIGVWLQRDSVAHLNWAFAGDRALELAAYAQRKDRAGEKYLRLAGEYYREAAVRYPTSVTRRVQLSVVLAILGDAATATEEAEQAVRLSQITPHADKKLEAQQVWLPVALPELEQRLSQEQRLHWDASGYVEAEPVVEWIRRGRDGFVE